MFGRENGDRVGEVVGGLNHAGLPGPQSPVLDPNLQAYSLDCFPLSPFPPRDFGQSRGFRCYLLSC